MKIENKERITFAAIKRPDNCIVFGKSHSDCFNVTPLGLVTQSDQGFLTNTFRFVSRKTAATIAFNAGQTKKDCGSLISEMLWNSKDGGKYDYDPVLGYIKRKKLLRLPTSQELKESLVRHEIESYSIIDEPAGRKIEVNGKPFEKEIQDIWEPELWEEDNV